MLFAVLIFLLYYFDDRVGVIQSKTLSGIRTIAIRAGRGSGEEELLVDLPPSQLQTPKRLETFSSPV
jgi:hypothetical protein